LCENGARGDGEEREERAGKMVKEEEGTDNEGEEASDRGHGEAWR
jgi:hypothetical protein